MYSGRYCNARFLPFRKHATRRGLTQNVRLPIVLVCMSAFGQTQLHDDDLARSCSSAHWFITLYGNISSPAPGGAKYQISWQILASISIDMKACKHGNNS